VHRAGQRIAQDLRLEDTDGDEIPCADQRVIGTVLGAADAQVLDEPLGVVEEEPGGESEDDQVERLGGRRHPERRASRTAAASAGTISNASPTMP
jgi:hypothetical protein